MKNFKKYLAALGKEFVFMITGSGLAVLWLLFSTYVPKLPESITQHQNWIFWSFIFLGFLISTYRAWLKLHISQRELEAKIKKMEDSSVQYEIQAEALRLVMDLDGILEQCKKNKEVAEIKIKKLSAPASNPFGIPDLALIVNPYHKKPTTEDWQNFIAETEAYEKEISEQSKMLDVFYKIRLTLENTGAVYDENISIHITPTEDCEDFDLYSSFHETGVLFQKPPAMPRETNMHDLFFPQGSPIYPLLSKDRYREPFRTVKSLSKTGIAVELRSLRAKDIAEIIYDGFYIMTGADKLTFDYEIRSKNTRDTIRGTLTVNVSNPEDSIDVFQEQEDED